MQIRTLIKEHPSANRCDVTPIFSDKAAFGELVEGLAEPFAKDGITLVCCIDALGFILGTAVAFKLDVGLVPIRKGGKLPGQCDSVDFVDYSGQTKHLELSREAIPRGSRVLLVDDWIETGAQATAAIQLIEHQGATVAGLATINIDKGEKTASLRANYRVVSAL